MLHSMLQQWGNAAPGCTSLGTIYLVHIVTYADDTEISHVDTSQVLKLWTLARSTREFKSRETHCA